MQEVWKEANVNYRFLLNKLLSFQESSVADPNSHVSALILVNWIRIGSRRTKLLIQIYKSEEISFFVAWTSLKWRRSDLLFLLKK
jgi:hypothetical protein